MRPCYNRDMDKLQSLIDARELATAKLRIHNLRGEKLGNDYVRAVEALQAACPHDDVLHDTHYHGGGYDYCASTDHTWTCKTCGKLIKHETKTHHGQFG